ncbi:MAG: exosortase system-associated protein, TIGR04073 family [Candidatus Omnitrophica bacterium]|nr:exosortase system-associated protein, TIGR04073 family [Candidatus Omnitrophota bacterium]
MIKKILLSGLIALFIITLAVPGFCDDPIKKLGRGLSNMVTFPLEIPEQIQRTNNSDGPFAALTVGVLKGLSMTVSRACVGVYEVATFLMPYPKDFKPVLKDPEYFLENSNF